MKKILFILLAAVVLFAKGFKTQEVKEKVEVAKSHQEENENPLVNITAAELKENKAGNKKENFTKSMVAIIDDIRGEIQEKRERAEVLSKKTELTHEEKVFMDRLFARYHIKDRNSEELLRKMILPPTSLILAQASLESGWAESNLAQEGNNLFGMKSFNKNEARIKKGGAVYRKYSTLRDSVEDYIVNLSRHNAYSNLRKAIRKGADTIELTNHLAKYCEDPKYGKVLIGMINDNDFMKYDA